MWAFSGVWAMPASAITFDLLVFPSATASTSTINFASSGRLSFFCFSRCIKASRISPACSFSSAFCFSAAISSSERGINASTPDFMAVSSHTNSIQEERALYKAKLSSALYEPRISSAISRSSIEADAVLSSERSNS